MATAGSMAAKKIEDFADVVLSLRRNIKNANPEAIAALSKWLKLNMPNLDTKFQWTIPSIAGVPILSGFPCGPYQSNAKENIALKEFLSFQWRTAKSFDERRAIASWVVIKWGGIPNSERTIENHACRAITPSTRYRHSRIASLSKILAASNPSDYAVYDARVAAALNAIQLRAAVSKGGIAFRYGSGRNGLISGKRDDSGRVIADGFQQRNSIASLRKSGWVVPGNGKNYLTYLALLQECKERIPGSRLVELEMTLFAYAEEVCAP